VLRAPGIERVHQRMRAAPITAEDVAEVMGLLADAGVRGWLAGGWGCDALLGEQTRPHLDLDLVVSVADEAAARGALERAGFYLEERAAAGRWMPVQLQMVDLGRNIGLHPVDFDTWRAPRGTASLREAAQAIGLPPVGEMYATGRVGGRVVPCLSVTAQLVVHCGYEVRDRDRRDMQALCDHFGLALPSPYEPVKERSGAAVHEED
jgi:lincosamide nucleotidyltransferase A/C/D/E